jgi:excisionase family DNA binding protein
MGDVVQMSKYRQAPEPWLNKRGAANHLGMSVRWVEAKVADAGMPSYLVGGVRLFKASELDDWVRSHAGPAA